MELNLDEIQEKVKPHIVEVLGPDAATKMGEQITGDVQLSLFFMIVLDFVRSVPTVVVDNVELLEMEGAQGQVAKLSLPIPSMFDQFYKMRIAQITGQSTATGFDVTQEIEEPSNAP